MLKSLFNKTIILKSLLTSLLFSLFIYLAYFDIEIKIVNSILALISLYYILQAKKLDSFWIGFFIGIFWFYWISLSFRYYDLAFLIPLIILGVGLVYGILFYLLGLIPNIFLRALIFIFAFDYIEPFGFNWFKPELIFIDTYFGIYKWQFGLIVFAVAIFAYLPKKYKLLSLIPLIASLNLFYPLKKQELPNLKIYVAETKLAQDKKWKRENLKEIVATNFDIINMAIKEKNDLVILPESAFPLFLNKEPIVMDMLKVKSEEIAILTGALKYEDEAYFNSSYLFIDGKVKIADKVVLVPFGESIPLPKFFVDLITRVVFKGAKDYETAKSPTDFNIKGVEFRNAICFEATREEIYEGKPKYILAISNNAWFKPSIEPTLQKLLMKYFSIKKEAMIFHSVNMSESFVIN